MSSDARAGLTMIGGAVLVLVVLAAGLMAGMPKYNEWRKEVNGQADLKKAQSTRQIRVEEARAGLEAAKLDAQSEIERAKGAAKAIEIEGGDLTDQYIRYRWVMQMENSGTRPDLIYVPTEAGLPMLEAGKR